MASGRGKTHVLLTGSPGVGKTTLCRKVYEILKGKGIKVQGFYNEEVRNGQKGRKVGFDVVTLDGQRGPLARTRSASQAAKARRSQSVGPYLVDVKSFEQLALPTMKLNLDKSKVTVEGKTLYILDEVGKMELFSKRFVSSVRELFWTPQATILSTVTVTRQEPIPFVDELKQREDVTSIEVTRDTRDELVNEVVNLLEESLMNE